MTMPALTWPCPNCEWPGQRAATPRCAFADTGKATGPAATVTRLGVSARQPCFNSGPIENSAQWLGSGGRGWSDPLAEVPAHCGNENDQCAGTYCGSNECEAVQ